MHLDDLPPKARAQALAQIEADKLRRHPVQFVHPVGTPIPNADSYKQIGITRGKGSPWMKSDNPFADYGIPDPVREYRFHPKRKWRFDYAWPDKKLAVEVDGGLYVNGGHSRGAARENDYTKDAEAMILGWRVLRVSTGQMRSQKAHRWLFDIFHQ